MKNKKLDSIINDVTHYFRFLYDKGFRNSSAEYSQQFNGNWVIEFESDDCRIFITSDRNYIILEFSQINNQDVGRRKTIEDIIYLVSNGRTKVKPFSGNLAWGKKKQLERLSLLLKEHIDQIISFYQSEETL